MAASPKKCRSCARGTATDADLACSERDTIVAGRTASGGDRSRAPRRRRGARRAPRAREIEDAVEGWRQAGTTPLVESAPREWLQADEVVQSRRHAPRSRRCRFPARRRRGPAPPLDPARNPRRSRRARGRVKGVARDRDGACYAHEAPWLGTVSSPVGPCADEERARSQHPLGPTGAVARRQ